MERFGIPKTGYKLFNGKVMFSRNQEEWKCAICRTKRPMCECAQIIPNVAATHGYCARKQMGDWEYQRAINTETRNKNRYQKYRQCDRIFNEITRNIHKKDGWRRRDNMWDAKAAYMQVQKKREKQDT